MTHPAVTIITPCFNEGPIVIKFLQNLEAAIIPLPYTFTVVVVDDCSADNTLSLLHSFRFKSAAISLNVIALTTNAGHQAAIYQGFLHAKASECNHFIVMDSDGQDAPSVIPALLRHLDADIVNVVRSKRTESMPFRVSYSVYKWLFRLATGKEMNYGNFCLISRKVLLDAVEANFSHFAAFLSKQRCTTKYIIANREPRLGGRSKMGFFKLMGHAFRSFGEYGNELRVPRFRVRS